MLISNIANVIDTEFDDGKLIEIGITTVNIATLEIIKTYSIPIKVEFEISEEIHKLTGWTKAKLNRQGVTKAQAKERLEKYGFRNRLIVSDTANDADFISDQLAMNISDNRLDLSVLYMLIMNRPNNLSLKEMVSDTGLSAYTWREHRADADSLAIAHLFIQLMKRSRIPRYYAARYGMSKNE